MADEVQLYDAWCVPAWDGGGPDVATRVLPPPRVRPGEPPEVALAVPELRPAHVQALLARLRETREGLLSRPAADVARVLGRVGERFLSSGDALRDEALAALPGTTGLSPAMCRRVLDGMARDWTGDRLERLLRADFADPRVLDGFVGAGSRLRALGAPVAFHVASGSVPGVSATSLIRSLLVKSPVLLKPGRGDVALPVLLLRGLAEEAPELARSAAVVYWPGGTEDSAGLEDAALAGADLVVAYGGDGVVRSLRRRLRTTVRLVAYHHRISVGILGSDALSPDRVEGAAAVAAEAVALFDQRGCVSPHVLFVEGSAGPFVDALARALERLDSELPPGRMDDAEASALHQLRGAAEIRRAAGDAVEVRSGGDSPWTVIVDPEGETVPSCLNRMVRVVPVDDVGEVPSRVAEIGSHLQSVGVLGIGPERLEPLAEALARVGALRVAPLDGTAFPPAWWRHDGRGPLETLVRWVELEEV